MVVSDLITGDPLPHKVHSSEMLEEHSPKQGGRKENEKLLGPSRFQQTESVDSNQVHGV